MIWTSVPLMTAIDLVIILITGAALWAFVQIRGHRSLLAQIGPLLIISGLLCITLFYFADLAAMHALPLFVPMTEAMAVMDSLHLNYRWGVMALSVSLIGVGLRVDIVERKNSEKALKESEARFRYFMDNSPTGIVIKDLEGRYLLVNEYYKKRYETTEAEIYGKTVHDFVPKELADGFTADDREVLEKRTPITREVALGDGKVLRIHKFPIFDQEENLIALGGIDIDITDIRHAEAALRESEEQFRSVSQSATDGIIVIDSSGIIQSWNRAAADLFGYDEDEVVGTSVDRILPERFLEDHKAALQRLSEGSKARLIGKTVELEGRRKDGSGFPLELSLGSWNAGGKTFFSGIIRDITGHKETERQLRQAQKIESMGSFTSGLTHELNNLLLPIVALTRMVLKGFGEEHPDRRKLEKVVEAGERATKLIGQVLAFSRQNEFKQENVKIAQVVLETVGLLRKAVPSTIKLIDRLDMDTGRVFSDPVQLQSVLMSVASNAMDAMEGRTGKMTISLSPVELNGEFAASRQGLEVGSYARLTVTDTGCGMDEKTLGRIFDPFFTTKEVGEGTGLGLSAAQGIVARHKGAIDVTSTPGVGTKVDIYLPLIAVEGDPMRASQKEKIDDQ